MHAAANVLALLLLALGSCQGLRRHHIEKIVEEDTELVAQPSKFGSLWPLPQKVQISDISFKLTVSSFRFVDAKESSAGPACTLLQDAYRRCRLCFDSLCLDSSLLCDKRLLCPSADIMNTCSGALKGRVKTKAGALALLI